MQELKDQVNSLIADNKEFRRDIYRWTGEMKDAVQALVHSVSGLVEAMRAGPGSERRQFCPPNGEKEGRTQRYFMTLLIWIIGLLFGHIMTIIFFVNDANQKNWEAIRHELRTHETLPMHTGAVKEHAKSQGKISVLDTEVSHNSELAKRNEEDIRELRGWMYPRAGKNWTMPTE